MTMTDHKKPHTTAAALTTAHITAPLNPHGQCFGLIPSNGDWLDDLIDWSRRQFKRPEDALRLAASWNLLAHIPTAELLEPQRQHPDDSAIDKFAAGLKAAMAHGRAQGKEGWDDPIYCSELHLRTLLRVAISKGDPLHVGNYAMMLYNRGERTAHPQAAALRAALEATGAEVSMPAVAPSGFDAAVKCLTKAFDALEATANSNIDHFEDEEDEAESASVQFASRKIAQALEYLYGFGLEAAAIPVVDIASHITGLTAKPPKE
jgi:hypothetical protein